MSKEDYKMYLLDIRWKIKASRIIERDKECQICGSIENLNVHHLYYPRDCMPWEIDDEYLIVLCKYCHKEEHMFRQLLKQKLFDMRSNGIMAKEILNKLTFG